MRLSLLLSALSPLWLPAATVSVPASNHGFYHQNGTFTSSTNHAVGYYTGTPPGELRNFFVFDLTGLAGNITAATLRAFNPSSGFSSPQGSETFTLFDVSTPLNTLTGLTGGTAAFADLGAGTPLGSVTVTSTVANTIVEVTLNAQGIAYLNSVTGRVAIGGALTTLAYGALSERLFNSATGAIVRELVVTTNDNPIPCAYSLSQTSLTIPAEGGNASVNLINSAGANCQWSVTNSAGWITLGTSSGTGSATIGFSAAANPSATQRSTTLTIAGQSLTMIQAATAPVTPTTTAQRFVSLTPCRLVETRQEYNFEGRSPPFGPPSLNAGETRTFTPSASNVCNVPVSAKSYVLNVTLVPRGAGVDFATLYPAGDARPDFWTVRSPDGLIVANSAIVRAGTGGALSLYASNSTDVLVDIAGYFTDNPAESNLVYYPLTPCRVIETRALYRPQPGPFGPPSLPRQTARSFRFPDNPYCVIPNGAAAYSVTLTVAPPAAPL